MCVCALYNLFCLKSTGCLKDSEGHLDLHIMFSSFDINKCRNCLDGRELTHVLVYSFLHSTSIWWERYCALAWRLNLTFLEWGRYSYLGCTGSQSVIPRPAASVSVGTVLELQILSPNTPWARPTRGETMGVLGNPTIYVLAFGNHSCRR